MTLRTSAHRLVVALGALVLAGVLAAMWMGQGPASASGASVTASPQMIRVPGSPMDLPGSLAGQVDAASLRLASSDGHLHHFLASGAEPGTVCLVSADDRQPMVAGVACDPTAVAARRGIYLLHGDADGGASGGMVLPGSASSARVDGRPGPVANGVLSLRLGAGRGAVVEPEGGPAVVIPAP